MMKELFFEQIDSTNVYLKDHYEDLEDMTFVRADYQSAGRGRSGRKWNGEKGQALMFSLLIKDERVIERFKVLSVLSAYSVLSVLEGYGLKDLSIKWPNDVYAGDKKICGILLESMSRYKIECLIVGIGLNVNQESFEGDFLHEPVSMLQLLGKRISIDEVKEKVYCELSKNILKLKDGEDLYPLFQKYDYLKGKSVYASIGKQRKLVSVVGIDRDCSLLVKDGQELLRLDSDEVTFHI